MQCTEILNRFPPSFLPFSVGAYALYDLNDELPLTKSVLPDGEFYDADLPNAGKPYGACASSHAECYRRSKAVNRTSVGGTSQICK